PELDLDGQRLLAELLSPVLGRSDPPHRLLVFRPVASGLAFQVQDPAHALGQTEGRRLPLLRPALISAFGHADLPHHRSGVKPGGGLGCALPSEAASDRGSGSSRPSGAGALRVVKCFRDSHTYSSVSSLTGWPRLVKRAAAAVIPFRITGNVWVWSS